MAEEQSGFRVTGVVQGVGFRWWARRKALALGLRGAAANLDDGSVEVNVSGSADAIVAFERALFEGPPGSRVRGVQRTQSRLSIPSDGFNIER